MFAFHKIKSYLFKGKSIADVGLAQGRYPLDTRCHYFEIEIVDPGENCYIAIGLARKDYPSRRHPGWNKGSIAYHADDGIYLYYYFGYDTGYVIYLIDFYYTELSSENCKINI